MLRVLPACLLAFALVAPATGCAHESAAERHAKELQDGRPTARVETDRTSGAKPPITRTIRLGAGEDAGEDDDPNAVSPGRPKIELQGPPGAAQRQRATTPPPPPRRIEMVGPTPEGEANEPPPTKVEAPPADDAGARPEPPKKPARPRDRGRSPDRALKETR